jgi:hypothetical protein
MLFWVNIFNVLHGENLRTATYIAVVSMKLSIG